MSTDYFSKLFVLCIPDSAPGDQNYLGKNCTYHVQTVLLFVILP
jgi:hypothetical protein